ncbi:SDR family oxidoreductase [Deinococcus sp. Leaf326]|uniref:SDR family oxidoreductase n=1 Tax=Deinococcus sp. Leaf326 TaxID=1736338 RepID=UPI0006FAB149|nr:SDR family NAD(P)-dependent oxidoreductase [Deinococcus sp. Leaf326]KQR19984.1 oxidoreductase [Deinococcus sp. Leaf326]
MNLRGNTILITGGGSGIGSGLAEAFHKLGNTVIIAGRRQQALDEVTAANPGMKSVRLDVDDADSIRSVMVQVIRDFPALNVLVNNAGIMQTESVRALPDMLNVAEATIATNLLGPIRLINVVLPHFHEQAQGNPQARATVINVTSGLAYVPRVDTPTYSATKAALHSYSQSLAAQLRGTSTQVIELIPPLVATELTPGQSANPRALPLSEYVEETMRLLAEQPEASEIVVERVKFQRHAEREHRYEAAFDLINQRD